MHPDPETLVSHRLGELPAQTQKAVSRHLASCRECREEFHRLAAPPPTADVDGMLSGLRAWESAEAKAVTKGDELKRQVSRALAPYLGKAATDSLLQSVREDGRNLLSKIGPVLTVFLGRRSAENLVTSIIAAAIVRI